MKRLVDDKKQELLDNLLESVSVDKNGNMEVGKNLGVDGTLTINSAKDLVTKDGTSIGGGSDFYEIEIIGDNFSSKLTEQQFNELKENTKNLKIKYKNEYYYFYYQWHTAYAEASIESLSYSSSYGIDYSKFVYGFMICYILKTTSEITINCHIATMPSSIRINSNNDYLELTNDDEAKVWFATINGQRVIDSASIADIKVQATLYRHTVEFSESGLGYTNRFTAYSEKNTPIDSIQDLITIFGNTKLQCSGTTNRGAEPCIGIDVGTNADTTFFVNITGVKQKISNWYSTQPESTLTITDSVTAM